ncbi:coiled-coil domain-containing protein 17-like [Hoplias malabaricus]|uniref:coiled-coil domain-containing protein 17-like n=1 Tax=Hoplias malabaricus TaxID=27720 RepID=UPI0034627009
MDSFVCSTCNMIFRSSNFLMKHKEKFCIGADHTEDSDFPQNLNYRIREPRRRQQQEKTNEVAQIRQQNFSQTAQDQLQINKSEPTAGRSHNQDLSEIRRHQVSRVNESKQPSNQKTEINQQELDSHNWKMAQLENMLLELNEQEQRNATLLETLLNHLQHNPTEPTLTTSNGLEGQEFLQKTHPPQHKPESTERVTQIFQPVYGSGVLTSEISTLHASYLQNGGTDPQILAQLQDLLNEALRVEMFPGKEPLSKTAHTERTKPGPKPKSKWNDFSKELISTELENQCLEEEIMRLQLKKGRSAATWTTTNVWPSEEEMSSMKMDIDLLKHELEINRLRRLIRNRKEEPTSQTLLLKKIPTERSEDLGPASYDPVAGFVVFYDFLLGLSPSFQVCRLMVELFSGEQCLGSPSVLPPVHCEPHSSSTQPTHCSQGQMAILAFKQTIPEVQPAPSVSLVMQVQVSGGYGLYDQEVTHLVPRGWAKQNIFDRHNHIISGRWKIPIRILPAKPTMTMAEVNAVPQLDSAELYLRIVNARDAELQSAVPISIYTATLYKYPPVTNLKNHFTGQDLHETLQTPAGHSPQVSVPHYSQSLDTTASGETLLEGPE